MDQLVEKIEKDVDEKIKSTGKILSSLVKIKNKLFKEDNEFISTKAAHYYVIRELFS